MKKLSTILLTLSLTSTIAVAQNTNGSSVNANSSNQSENTNNLASDFYVDSDGLIVYRRSTATAVTNTNTSPVATNNQEQATAEPNNSRSTSKPISKGRDRLYEDQTASNNETAFVVRNESADASVTPVIIRKKAIKITDSVDVRPAQEEAKETATSEPMPQSINFTRTPEKTTSNKISQEEAKRKYTKFKKYEKQESQYKSIEEAALAVDALLEDLKKSQNQTSGSRSMSSRLSTGANRTGLKKKPLSSSSTYTPPPTSSMTSSASQQTETSDSFSEWDSEPTYYINGNEVEKNEVDQLRSKDIISKQIKMRNTRSGNPNGEVWYEVKKQ